MRTNDKDGGNDRQGFFGEITHYNKNGVSGEGMIDIVMLSRGQVSIKPYKKSATGLIVVPYIPLSQAGRRNYAGHTKKFTKNDSFQVCRNRRLRLGDRNVYLS